MPNRQPIPQAVFLDRDGTLIENRHYLSSPEGVALLPGVREGLQVARERGAKLFLFTNQSGVGRGMFTLADVEAVNRRMIEMLGLGDDLFAGICIAPERPDEPVVWEAGLNAGIRSAAIVANAAAEVARDQRLALGVEAYATLHEWATAVFG
jgi:histidinol phosphatase-like enzyme